MSFTPRAQPKPPKKPSYLPLNSDQCESNGRPALSLQDLKQKLWTPVLFITLAIIAIILSISVVAFVEGRNGESERSRVRVSAPIMQFPMTTRTFLETPSFENLTTEAQISAAWGDYGLPSYGFITLSSPGKFNLPPNEDVVPGATNAYMISVYHQLHCLKALHVALLPVIVGAERGGAEDVAVHQSDENQAPGASHSGFEHNHIEHCLDYLRQAVMCAGDVTLEPPDQRPQEGKSPLQGWGVEHRCRSWEGIERWRGENGVI
ncbi:hypothetical protein BDW74DRAFT_183120 [Aspergillus multicolor]|uniref:uncharacterized protein n=1 Tax=Aspergillus multicolor TaxID=41759 RepID=UPI003CCDCA81